MDLFFRRNCHSVVFVVFVCFCSWSAADVFAQTARYEREERRELSENTLELRSGFDFTTGDYGSDLGESDSWIMPIELSYQSGDIQFFASVPFVKYIDPDEDGGRMTTSGWGDLELGAAYVFDVMDSGSYFDLEATVGLPTADEDEGVGSGLYSYAGDLNYSWPVGDYSFTGGIGYSVSGDSDVSYFPGQWTASFDVGYDIAEDAYIGATYEWSPAGGGFGPSSLVEVYAAYDLVPAIHLNPHVLAGLSENSPDYGAGLSVGVRY